MAESWVQETDKQVWDPVQQNGLKSKVGLEYYKSAFYTAEKNKTSCETRNTDNHLSMQYSKGAQ